MKKKDCLTLREEELLNILWEMNEPLTTGEMVERLEKDGWNTATLFKTVRSLSDMGYLKITGLEKNAKAYSRKLAPAMTKEEYYAGIMMKRGLDISSIADITAAFLGVAGKSDEERDAEVIAKLEEVISTLRKSGEGENGN
ncbi:MAG: BlaI/MecI/CopY family transcriptional regulator [Acetatifactor sp.]|nr:BlaI/MecI/CopY family transcriptional regulator [Acetatifactor sp.]